jgi:cation/acetate symporter
VNDVATAAAVVSVVVATCSIGLWGMRLSRTTSDFLVASRTVSTTWNASAISGEYLSAASFLGVAGLVMTYGVDMLWYPVGFVAGYLVLLLLVAAPLRRSGAYTLADFAETRLASLPARRLAGLLVVAIAWLYLLPQLQGAGLTISTVTGAPAWVGPAVVTVVVVGNVLGGGMRSITLVQAFQYWLKMFAIALPALVLLSLWHQSGSQSLHSKAFPTFRTATTVRVESAVRLVLPSGKSVEEAKGTVLHFAAGEPVPVLSSLPRTTGSEWSTPFEGDTGSHPLYRTYSLIFATFLGTMGLPHVLVRFYTNPDGRAARRTTLVVIGLLGVFYLFPTVYGALGRLYTPQLLLTGQTDAVVLLLPNAVVGGAAGSALGALVAAGAFAAFLSTSSGLVVSVAGVLGQDVLGGTIRSYRQATLLAGTVPLALSFLVAALPVSEVVAMAFAVAASSFCPLLLLGIWWTGLTDAGAIAGLVIGGGSAVAAVSLRIAGDAPPGWASAVLAQPAAVTVPLAFATMVVVSRLTSQRRPTDLAAVMRRMHAPEMSAR